ncbi:MAG: NADH-quinone oxidoreductase subunit A [Candidatus Hodarchaeales archaeon]|jgi:NADH-quinone oxidoreductase subunit A
MPKFVHTYTYNKPRERRSFYINSILKFIVLFSGIMLFLFVVSDLLFVEDSLIMGTILGDDSADIFRLTYDGASVFSQEDSSGNLKPVPVYTAYVGFLIGLIIGVGMFCGALILNMILAPPGGKLRKRVIFDDEYAETTYECGENPIGEGRAQANLQYYSFALVFIVFDIVTALALMFAAVFSLGGTGIESSIKIGNATFTPEVIDVGFQVVGISLFIGLPLIILAFWMKRKAIFWE